GPRRKKARFAFKTPYVLRGLDRSVAGVHVHDLGLVVPGLVVGHQHVGDDDHDVAFGAQAGGGAVEADVPPAGRAGDDVGFQAAAVVDVDYLHLFEGQDVGQLHQLLIDGDASFIVQVGVGNGGTVDLRLAHGAQHRHPPSFWSFPPG